MVSPLMEVANSIGIPMKMTVVGLLQKIMMIIELGWRANKATSLTAFGGL